MKSWVVDCSMVMAWCLPDESSAEADRFFASLTAGSTLMVPSLFWHEVADTLVMAVRQKRLSAGQASRLEQLLADLPVSTVPSGPGRLATHVALASQSGLSAHDATYLDLAQRMPAGLATLDLQLLKTARELGVDVPTNVVE